MKDLLLKLSKEELYELGDKYIHNFKRKAPAIVASQLSKIDLDEEDVAWIKQAAAGETIDKLQLQEAIAIKKSIKPSIETNYIDENTGRLLTTAEIEQKARTQGEQLLRDLMSEARRVANQTVIAYVTPASQEDINIQKTCESFITGNAYFTISVVVPFAVHVEIPKAIAQVIKEATCPQVIELNDYQSSKIPGRPIAAIQTIRRYNIQTWTKEEYEKMQEPIV